VSDLTTRLLRSGLAGNAADLEVLLVRLTPLLRAVARRCLRTVVGVGVDPDDVVQDVWLRCLPRLGAVQPRDGRITPPVVKYLSTAIQRRARDELLRLARQWSAAAPEASGGELPAATAGVLTRLFARERQDVVLQAIEALDEIDRDALVLVSIEQVPLPEAALILGISSAAVRQRHHRAKERLRAELPDSLFDELD
jgi:RNA polymerase sigma factor (sigma-70 family)